MPVHFTTAQTTQDLEQILALQSINLPANISNEEATKQGFESPSFLMNETTAFKIVSNKKVKEVLNYTFHLPDPMTF